MTPLESEWTELPTPHVSPAAYAGLHSVIPLGSLGAFGILPFLSIPTLPAIRQNGLRIEQSKFATELLAGEWEWEV